MNLIRKQKFIKEGPDLKFYLAEIIVAVEQLHGKHAKLHFFMQVKTSCSETSSPRIYFLTRQGTFGSSILASQSNFKGRTNGALRTVAPQATSLPK